MLELSVVFLAAALTGVVILLAQYLGLLQHLATPPPKLGSPRGISILKPLCGLDDALEESLERFATLTYPHYELLLGVKDTEDEAFALARRVSIRHPHRVRVVVQRGAPTPNPKINQLISLEREATHELLMISDSNAVVENGTLEETSAYFADSSVGCVANPVSGRGHQTLGALLDNLHLASFLGPGQAAAKRLSGRDVVIGKSMTIRRTLLKSMGGFGTFGDYAAEDFALGAAVRHQGLQNVIARRLVWNVSRRRSLVSFCERYRRWAVLQRTGVSLPVSLAQSLLNPWPLSVLALLFSPGPELTASSLAILACRVAIDLASAHALGLMPFGIEAALVVPLKDLILFAAWVEALFRRTIVWRGTRLKVSADGRLIRHKVRDAAWEGAR